MNKIFGVILCLLVGLCSVSTAQMICTSCSTAPGGVTNCSMGQYSIYDNGSKVSTVTTVDDYLYSKASAAMTLCDAKRTSDSRCNANAQPFRVCSWCIVLPSTAITNKYMGNYWIYDNGSRIGFASTLGDNMYTNAQEALDLCNAKRSSDNRCN